MQIAERDSDNTMSAYKKLRNRFDPCWSTILVGWGGLGKLTTRHRDWIENEIESINKASRGHVV